MAYSFNSNYYLANNPGVAQQVQAGVFTSAEQHFNMYGQFEGRNPNSAFDTSFYFAQNPGVVSAVLSGAFASVLDHYEQFGAAEGRQFQLGVPFNETYYLATYPGVADAIAAGNFVSGWQHYTLYGFTQGFTPASGVTPPSPTPIVQTFTLTAAADGANDTGSWLAGGGFNTTGFKFTTGNQVVNATDQTLNNFPSPPAAISSDVLADPSTADADQMNLTMAANTAVFAPNGGMIQNIETINITATNPAPATFDTFRMFGIKTIDIDGAPAGAVTILGNTGAQNFDSSGTSTVDGSGIISSVVLTVDNTNGTLAMSMIGGAGADALTGGSGADNLNGSGGNDTLVGNNGNDTITGGRGADNMTGGNGADTFAYGSLATLGSDTGASAASADTITDFTTSTTDKIQTGVAGTATNYTEAVNAGTTVATALAAATALMAGDNNLIYYFETDGAANGFLAVDTNADHIADSVIQFTGLATAGLNGFTFGDIVA
jgi:Ca2+-binding RTX toxin-like protein